MIVLLHVALCGVSTIETLFGDITIKKSKKLKLFCKSWPVLLVMYIGNYLNCLKS